MTRALAAAGGWLRGDPAADRLVAPAAASGLSAGFLAAALAFLAVLCLALALAAGRLAATWQATVAETATLQVIAPDEAKYGPNSRSQFAGHSYDAFEILKRIIPAALKTAKPGTPEFREAIRQALLSEKELAASQGVYNFTEKDRYGLDERSRILLTVKNGKYMLVK